MKKFFVTLVAVTFLFLIGCQENPVTAPDQSLNKQGNSTIEEIINLCCPLEDPAGGNCQLTGEVSYIQQVSQVQVGLYEVTLELNMNAQLCSLDNPTLTQWAIAGQSMDEFSVSEEGIYVLEKGYLISNRTDVLLIVDYLVTTEGVGITNLWLMEID